MKSLFLIVFLFVFLPLYTFASDTTQAVGRFGHWRVYTAQEGKGTVCFMVTSPQQTTVKREDNYLSITHRPHEKTYDVISVMLGTNYQKNSKPTIGVDNKRVTVLDVDGDAAFVKDPSIEKQLIEEMIIGNVVRTQSKSAKGTVLRETFSLKGFSKAYEALQKSCSNQGVK